MADGRHRARPGAFASAKPSGAAYQEEVDRANERKQDRLTQRVTALFYVMLRDMMPFGALDQMVIQLAIADDFEFDNDALEELARDLTTKLGAKGRMAWSRDTREWIATFPARTRESTHFEQVLAEFEGKLTLTDATKQTVIAEVVRREREALEATEDPDAPEAPDEPRIVGR